MTTTRTTTEMMDHTIRKTTCDHPLRVQMVDVTVRDLDTVHQINPGLCAVMPAYNEELVIGSVVLRTRQYAGRVIVVDDGSSDHTAEVARLAGADVVQLEHNTG